MRADAIWPPPINPRVGIGTNKAEESRAKLVRLFLGYTG